MKISTIVKALNARIVNLTADSEVLTGYCGDLLSHVMGNAPQGCCWFTVMTNINVAGVASLADIALVVVCEGARSDSALIDKAKREGVNLIETELDIFGAALKVFG